MQAFQTTHPSPSSLDRLAETSGPARAHLVGIGGAGMRSLAEVLLQRGWILTGSDLNSAEAAFRERAGLRLFTAHAAENVPVTADLLIASDAIPATNPELRRAVELGIPACSYFQALGRMMTASKRGIAVAGTHGKSTTAAMLAEMLVRGGQDPTVVYGAAPLGHCHGGRAGRGDTMLVEACEYQANFLHLRPRQAVILGVEPDHFDCYATPAELHRAFACFAAALPPDGLLVVRHECPVGRRIADGLTCQVETFGFHANADWSVDRAVSLRGRWRFRILRAASPIAEIALQAPGWHNVLNALAAAALAWNAEVSPEQIAAGLEAFAGLHRRFELRGAWRGVTLVDDYAHHPTEVIATLATARRMYPGRRLWCVFQPHQASRTRHLLDELAASLQNADRVVVADIFRAREPQPVPGEVTAADLAEKTRRQGAMVESVHAAEEIVAMLEERIEPGDVLITMGAGDIRKIGDGIIERFREDRAAS